MATKKLVSKDNLGRAWTRLFEKVLNSKEEIEANKSENMIAGADAVKEVYSSLTANGSQLCMDYHDGKYGVNTDPQRGADTFIPFRSGNDVKVISLNGTGRASKNIDFSYLANYSALTNDAFAVCPTAVQNYGSSPNTSLTINTSYNEKTGILTVTANEADGFRFNVNNVCVYVK